MTKIPQKLFDIVLPVTLPQLAAQVADVHLEGAFDAVGRVEADEVEQVGFGDHLGGILQETF